MDGPGHDYTRPWPYPHPTPWVHPSASGITVNSCRYESGESNVSWGSLKGPHLSRLDPEINILCLTGHNLMESVLCCNIK